MTEFNRNCGQFKEKIYIELSLTGRNSFCNQKGLLIKYVSSDISILGNPVQVSPKELR